MTTMDTLPEAITALIAGIRAGRDTVTAASALADLAAGMGGLEPGQWAAVIAALVAPPEVPEGSEVTGEEVAEWERLAEGATAGPWVSLWGNFPPREDDHEETIIRSESVEGFDGFVVGQLWYDGLHTACRQEDAAFIAAARSAVPKLCAAVRVLTARGAELERMLAEPN